MIAAEPGWRRQARRRQAQREESFRRTVDGITAGVPESLDPWSRRMSFAAGDVSTILSLLAPYSHGVHKSRDHGVLRAVVVALLSTDPVVAAGPGAVLDAAAAAGTPAAPGDGAVTPSRSIGRGVRPPLVTCRAGHRSYVVSGSDARHWCRDCASTAAGKAV